MAVKAQQFRQLLLIEAYHNLIIDQGDGRGHKTEFLQFFQSGLVSGDVPIFKRYPVARKKLFRSATEHSTGLAKNDYFVVNHLR